jgi:hypothetical protein
MTFFIHSTIIPAADNYCSKPSWVLKGAQGGKGGHSFWKRVMGMLDLKAVQARVNRNGKPQPYRVSGISCIISPSMRNRHCSDLVQLWSV